MKLLLLPKQGTSVKNILKNHLVGCSEIHILCVNQLIFHRNIFSIISYAFTVFYTKSKLTAL